MPDTKPSPLFLAAASYLLVATSPVSTSTKLELYGLYKYVTVSSYPSTSRPSIFDITGRAKWDAWSSAGKKYTSVEDAENRYLEVARDLGWIQGSVVESPPQTKNSNADSIWDDDSQPRRGYGSSGGMGVAVSTMMTSDSDNVDASIHGFAVSNDITGLSTLFQRYPEMDINGLDEFGYTPLHLACDRGNLSTVEFLLSKGANPAIKDPDGLSASELAAIAGHDNIEKCLRSLEGR